MQRSFLCIPSFRLLQVIHQMSRCHIQTIECLRGSINPHILKVLIFRDALHTAVGARSIRTILQIHLHLVAVISCQSVVGRKPHESFLVLVNVRHGIRRQPVLKGHQFGSHINGK